MGITVDFDTSYIEITSPDTEVTFQQLYDAIRMAEATKKGIIHDIVCGGEGKTDIKASQNIKTALTLTLYGTWLIRFHSGAVNCTIYGGNIAERSGTFPVEIRPGQAMLVLSHEGGILIQPDAEWTSAEKTQLFDKISEVAGLSFQNTYRHSIVRDPILNTKVLSEQLDAYDSAANAETHDGSTGLLHSWSLSYTYDGSNNLTAIKCLKL